jgi:aminopeptidase N
VQVTLYDLPSADLLGELDLPIHRAFLAWMETQFGPYPYGDEMRLFAAPLFWGGFEHPGNIVLDDGLFGGGFTQTLHHEIGHMWAGNQATLLSIHDFVWKEAMVEYLVFVFADEQPEPIAGRNKPLTWKAQGLNADFFPVPLEHPELLDFYSDVYSEGPMVLFRQTEALLGRDAVLQALASLLGKPGFHGIDDIRAALEAATGADLTEYFATWVVGEGRPARPTFDIEVAVPTAGDAVGITVRQQDPEDGLFGCAFAVELRGSAGQRHDAWIDLGPDGMSELVVEAEPGFVVESAAFDPQAHCLGRADVALVPTE